MTGNAAPRVRGGPVPSALPSDSLTRVELTHVEKKIENWIRFGREAHEQILDRRRRVFAFRPDTIFAFVRWASNDFGTIISRIDIVRAVEPHEPYQTLPFVRPGGDILLKIEGWPKVEQVLRHIDAIQAIGLYDIDPPGDLPGDLIVPDLVAVDPPEALAEFMVERGYIGRGVPLLKRVMALPGQEVCRVRRTITVDGIELGAALDRDRTGRDLPVWQGCRRIAGDEIFLMNPDVRDSLDGRYFGPIPVSAVIGRATPIYTDEDGDGRFVWRAATR